MNTEAIIAKATAQIKSSPGYHFDPAVLRSAIEAGLVDGDSVRVRGMYAKVAGGIVTVTRDGHLVIATMAVADMPDDAVEAMLTCKGVQASSRPSEVGTVAGI